MLKLTVVTLIKTILLIVFLLISIAYFTLLERKIIASIQRRKGPNVVGFSGLIQAIADGIKLFSKETIIPSNSDNFVFLLAPVLTFTLSLLGWSVIPLTETVVISDINIGLLFIMSVSSMGTYGIIIAGWGSNSKYALLGGLRSVAQMISYEIPISFIFINVSICSGSLNLSNVVLSQKKIWYVFPLFPIFIVFCICMLAETNRHPFDLPEAEAELVSGYNVEYSAITFTLFFLSEYANILLMSSICIILFLGGWLPIIDVYPINILPGSFWFSIKLCFGIAFFILTRAILPRYRYDQLMNLGWKSFLPLTLSYFVFTVGVLLGFNWLPNLYWIQILSEDPIKECVTCLTCK